MYKLLIQWITVYSKQVAGYQKCKIKANHKNGLHDFFILFERFLYFYNTFE